MVIAKKGLVSSANTGKSLRSHDIVIFRSRAVHKALVHVPTPLKLNVYPQQADKWDRRAFFSSLGSLYDVTKLQA